MASNRYSALARWLHWIVGIAVIGQIGLGFAANWSGREQSRLILPYHVQLGLLILGLMVLRITWRLVKRPPPYSPGLTQWQRSLATMVHWMLYALLLAMPVTGYVLWAWRGPVLKFAGVAQIPILFEGGDDEFWQSIAGYAHEYGAFLLTGLILLHVTAALYHQFIARDLSIGQRMGLGPLDRPAASD